MSFLFAHNPANCSNDPTVFGSEENKFKRNDSNKNDGEGLIGSVFFPETNYQ